MSSASSLKDLCKAISAFFSEPFVPLPDELVNTIVAYVRQHEEYDEAVSDRLQAELISIFDKQVKGNPEASGAWIATLRRLLPVLRTPDRILQWFDRCHDLIDATATTKRSIMDEALASLVDLVKFADEQYEPSEDSPGANPIVERLLFEWMDRLYPTWSEGGASAEHHERMIRESLMHFGKKRPKELFISLDGFVVQKQYRKYALRFLCDFVQNQPPHLYLIRQTPLFSSLLTCLQQDTSTTVISAALTALIMLLPHMPSSLVPHLPSLFNIYARLLFWNREKSKSMEASLHEPDHIGNWELCIFDPDIDATHVPQLSNYYTILYGLYPINFMDYIRKPQRYLRHAHVSDAEDMGIQPTEIRHHSEKFRRYHLLHPNFYTLTIDSEKTDFGRWIKAEAAEVVAECMSLCLAPDPNFADGQNIPPMPGAPAISSADDEERESFELALLSGSVSRSGGWGNVRSMSAESLSSNRASSALMRHGSQSSRVSNREYGEARSREPSAGSPILRPQLTISASQTQLQDLIQSNKAIKSGLHQTLPNDSVPSLALSQQEPAAEKSIGQTMGAPPSRIRSPMSSNGGSTQAAQLQRQILLLQNDLSFERYLKQQHIAHIGELRRRQVVEAASEAETQNLIMMNRNLKSRFEEAKKAEMQVRKESEKSRALTKKWEADLANKLKNLRDESKKMNADFDAVRKELEDTKQECEKLRQLVCAAEVQELNWKQNLQSIEIQSTEMERLKAEVERLTISELDHQAKEVERQAAINSAHEAEAAMKNLRSKLEAQENEVQEVKKMFQSQITLLQEKLANAQELHERAGNGADIAIEGALAASRAKQAEMQKQHSLLMRKYTALQSSLLDMQSGATLGQHHTEASAALEAEMDQGPKPSHHATPKAQPHQKILNPETPEAIAYNVTPPLDLQASRNTPAGSQQPPHSPLTADTAGSLSLSASPEHRIFGRGGVQNRIRKESKSKDKDESAPSTAGSSSGTGAPPKKEKKSTGLRGIRGLVG